jgi:hypothetical protein
LRLKLASVPRGPPHEILPVFRPCYFVIDPDNRTLSVLPKAELDDARRQVPPGRRRLCSYSSTEQASRGRVVSPVADLEILVSVAEREIVD